MICPAVAMPHRLASAACYGWIWKTKIRPPPLMFAVIYCLPGVYDTGALFSLNGGTHPSSNVWVSLREYFPMVSKSNSLHQRIVDDSLPARRGG
eukprot:scaffold3939_cov166-Amphora_coffeaeformis.AAC.19